MSARLGVWAAPEGISGPDTRAMAGRVEELGYSMLWLAETFGRCYGMQLVTDALGGEVAPAPHRQFRGDTVKIEDDAPMLAWAEGVQSDFTEDVIRIVNRFGGGMNPVLIIAFFVVAGIAYAQRRWVSYAIAMALTGLAAGIAGQIVKQLVGRARPELWLGPSHYAPGSSTSFPSGHTVGAFALAGILVFGSRSWPLRVIAFLLAASVGLSRVLAFRHWPSDVTASAVVGLVTAWIVTRVSFGDARDLRAG